MNYVNTFIYYNDDEDNNIDKHFTEHKIKYLETVLSKYPKPFYIKDDEPKKIDLDLDLGLDL